MSQSALFADRATIQAGPGVHDLLKSLEEGKLVQFKIGGRELDFRVIALEVVPTESQLRAGGAVEKWGIKALCFVGGSPEKTYSGTYNSRSRSGQFERPNTLC